MPRTKAEISKQVRDLERKKRERAKRKKRSTRLVSAPPKKRPRRTRKSPASTGAPELRKVPRNYEEAKALYGTTWYKEWRDSILIRDGHMCQMCGGRTRPLEVHHIRPKYQYPELTLDIDNGITLCKVCHQDRVTRHEHRFVFIFDRIVKLNK